MDLSEKALEDAIVEISQARDERGALINIHPTEMRIVDSFITPQIRTRKHLARGVSLDTLMDMWRLKFGDEWVLAIKLDDFFWHAAQKLQKSHKLSVVVTGITNAYKLRKEPY